MADEWIAGLRALLQDLARTDRAHAHRAVSTALSFEVGQEVEATVLARLVSGRFVVAVGEQRLDVNLPARTQAGEVVRLQVVATTPELRFVLIQREGFSREPSPGAELVARPAVTLSAAARELASLLTRPAAERDAAAAHEVLPRATTPVLAAPTTQSALIAQGLRTALTESGLFYEHHLAQWLAGAWPLARLLREPQGRWSQARAFAQASLVQDGNAPLAAGEGAAVRTAAQPASSSKLPAAETLGEDAAVARERGWTGAPDSEALVRAQVEALTSRQVHWHGELWPGLACEWQIEEREAREAQEGCETVWQTRVALVLPRLGPVEAVIRLTATGVTVRLGAEDAPTRERLAGALAELSAGLERAGLSVVQMEVAHAG